MRSALHIPFALALSLLLVPAFVPSSLRAEERGPVYMGLDFDVEIPGIRHGLSYEYRLFADERFRFGLGSSLGRERVRGEKATDFSPLLTLTGVLAGLLLYPMREDESFPFWTVHLAHAPTSHLDFRFGDRLRWSLGVGLHGRFIGIPVDLPEPPPDTFVNETGGRDFGFLFAPGPRVSVEFAHVRLLARVGTRWWIRERQPWENDGVEFRLRAEISNRLWDRSD